MKQFLTIEEAAREFSRNPQTIERMLRKIREHPDRYDETNFFGKGKKILIRTACLMDWDDNGELLENYPDVCPKYNPRKYEDSFGFTERYPTALEIAKEVVYLIRGIKNDDIARGDGRTDRGYQE